MKKVLCFGTFDIVHPGHVYFLKEAKKHGDFLVVAIARDVTVEKLRKRPARNNEMSRVEEVKKLGIADEVVLGDKKDHYKILDKMKPDIICLGYDQRFFIDELKSELEKRKIDCEVLRMKAYKPEKYKSSKLST